MSTSLTLLICPEAKGEYFVSLWTVASESSEVKRASSINWLVLSQAFQSTRAMSDSTLGVIDACIGRGEAVRVSLSSVTALGGLAFEAAASMPRLRTVVRDAAA